MDYIHRSCEQYHKKPILVLRSVETLNLGEIFDNLPGGTLPDIKNLVLDRVKSVFESLASKLETDIHNKNITIEPSIDYYGYDGAMEVSFGVYSLETKSEFDARLEEIIKREQKIEKRKQAKLSKKEVLKTKAAEEEALQREQRRALYETLKKEFDNETPTAVSESLGL